MPRYFATAVLLGIGCLWGLGVPLWKVASELNAHPLGFVVWQLATIVLGLGPLMWISGERLPLTPAALVFYAVLGMAGAVLPGALYVLAVRELPAGAMVITIALVPMFTYAIAIALKSETFRLRPIIGVVLGFGAISLMFAPGALPDAAVAPFLLLGVLTALFYAVEGNFIALRMPESMSPLAALVGASGLMLVLLLPIIWAMGGLISPFVTWQDAHWALLAGCVTHVISYAGYVWLTRQGGALFASLVGYIVTITGVIWSAVLLSEAYSTLIWLAFAAMLVGLMLVQPRREVQSKGPVPKPGSA